MISAIAPRVATSYAPVHTASQAPAQNTAAPAQDTVDFTSIDTPAEAAQLPILEPSFQLALAGGVIAAIMAGMGGGGVPLVDIGVASQSGGAAVDATYSMDFKNEQNPLTISGHAGGQALSGGFSLDEASQSVTWNGRIGENAETLQFTLDEASESLRLQGNIGTVAADLSFSVIGEDMENPEGFRVAGTLGGESYESVSTFKLAENPEEAMMNGEAVATMHTRGHVGEAAISKDYEAKAFPTGSGITVSVEGSGQNAGLEQQVSTTLTIVP